MIEDDKELASILIEYLKQYNIKKQYEKKSNMDRRTNIKILE